MESKSTLDSSNVTKNWIYPSWCTFAETMDGNAAHFLPVVKCTLICCHTKLASLYFQSSLRQALNWLDRVEKADWLARVMFALCCLYVVFQDGSWWELNLARWRVSEGVSQAAHSWNSRNVADGAASDWKYWLQWWVKAQTNIPLWVYFYTMSCCDLHE